METSLGVRFPIEQARVRKILTLYHEIGLPGRPGAFLIEQVLQRADQAIAGQDVVEMIRSYEEMLEVKE